MENERFIFAAFIVDSSYVGDDQDAGYVKADLKHKVALTKAESKKMPFWNYHKNDNSPEREYWGSGLFRYFDDIEAREILRDIVKVKKGTPGERDAVDLLNEFCARVGVQP